MFSLVLFSFEEKFFCAFVIVNRANGTRYSVNKFNIPVYQHAIPIALYKTKTSVFVNRQTVHVDVNIF